MRRPKSCGRRSSAGSRSPPETAGACLRCDWLRGGWPRVGEGCRGTEPDIVLVDVGLPVMNGLEAGRALKKLMPQVKLFYSQMDSDPDIANEAFRIGASGYMLKSSMEKSYCRPSRKPSVRIDFTISQRKMTKRSGVAL